MSRPSIGGKRLVTVWGAATGSSRPGCCGRYIADWLILKGITPYRRTYGRPHVETPPNWLASQKRAMPTLIVVSVWKQVGYNMVIFLAGAAGRAGAWSP
jgi:ABC-type sugar transport system permease subunit